MTAFRELTNAAAKLVAFVSSQRGWSPHKPWPKQQAWIDLDTLESLYGGGAGGGKTDALLASGLRFVDTPGYAALILRRTFPDLNLPGAVMDRSHEWLDDTKARWNERDKQWLFPSGAVLQFGYCDTKNDLQRYKSAEFQFIGIDELTEWPAEWYTFLFSRLRRRAGVKVPLRMRGATNPDGIGSPWVRKRFRIPEGEAVPAPIWASSSRVFWPALADDNPSIDLPAYEQALEAMTGGRDGVKWKQLRCGLWIRDDEGLVYSFHPDRNRGRANVAEEIERGVVWHFMLGIDYGNVNETAFVVIGWREHEQVVYVVETQKEPDLIPDEAAQIVASLESRYHFEAIIGDTGGLGKGYSEEARKRWGIPVEPAEKNNKRGYIKLFNGALRSGQILVLPGNDELEHEWEVLPWAEGRKEEAAGFANHLADAALYVWRASFAYCERPKPDERPQDLQSVVNEEEQRLAEEQDAELAEKGRGWVRRMMRR